MLGERKNAAKILNSEERLAQLARLQEERQQHADEAAWKVAAFAHVNRMLHLAGIIDEPAYCSNKRPTVALLRLFVNKWPEVIAAWRLYTQKHGVGSGDTIAWRYYFDYVHGGHTGHETVKEGRPALPLVIDDRKAEASAEAPAAP